MLLTYHPTTLQSSASLTQLLVAWKDLSLNPKLTDWEAYCKSLNQTISLDIRLKSAQKLDVVVQSFTDLLCKAAATAKTSTQQHPSLNTAYPGHIHYLIRLHQTARKKWQRTRCLKDKSAFNSINHKLTRELWQLRNERLLNYLSSLSVKQDNDYSLWKAKRKCTKAPTDHIPPLHAFGQSGTKNEADRVETFALHLAFIFQSKDVSTQIIPAVEFPEMQNPAHFTERSCFANNKA